MYSRGVVPDSPQYKTPNYPVISVFWACFYSFHYLFYSLGHLTLFEESECPMSVAIVSALRIVHLGLVAYIYCLGVVLMHVVDECQIVISIWMFWVDLCADFEMLNSHSVLLLFKICKTEVVLELIVIGFKFACFLEGCNGVVVKFHFVEGYSKEKESSITLSISRIKLFYRCLL